MMRLSATASQTWPILVATLCGLLFCGIPLREASAQLKAEPPVPADHPFPHRIKAPTFEGGVEWMNTAGPLEVKDLRGKFIILDFWTYCCINCMHILPELKKLEHAYPNELVVIGVHSAKFDGEKESKNIREAILRYEIEHPVVNDSEHKIWEKFRVNSWPSLRAIDPEGYVIAEHSGEIDFDSLNAFLKKALPYYKKKGLLDETPLQFQQEKYAEITPLRFPGKVLADAASNRLFIADSNHNRIVITDLAGKLLDVIGSGVIGKADGEYHKASFDHPQGMALLGQTLYVADTENHMLRKVDLEKQVVSTIAGTGEQRRLGYWPGFDPTKRDRNGEPIIPKRWVDRPRTTALNSPWALYIHQNDLYVAMAGPHQIWKMTLDQKEIGPWAGNGREDIVDGPHLPPLPYEEGFSSFAQPSGLASDGKALFVADSEGSSIRTVPFDTQQAVTTLIGTAELPFARLFTFGDVDGPASKARLQHPLGVVYHEGLIYVTDTYNNKIKVVDVAKQTVTSLSGIGKPGKSDNPAEFDEPAGISYAAGKLYIADTNNHSIRTIDLKTKTVSTLAIAGLSPPVPPKPDPTKAFAGGKPVSSPAVSLKPVGGNVQLNVKLSLPEGYKINTLAPMRYLVQTTSDAGPIKLSSLNQSSRVAEPKNEFTVSLPVQKDSGTDSLKLSLIYYYCKEGAEGICKMGTVTWTLPLTIDPQAKESAAALDYEVK